MIELPQSIRVGNYIVNIRIYDESTRLAANGNLGWFDSGAMCIYIFESSNNDQIFDTFMHEVFHAIRFCHGLKVSNKEEEEEEFIRSFVPAWVQLFLNNVSLLDLLSKYRVDFIERLCL